MPPNVRQLHDNRHKPKSEGVQAVVAAPTMPSGLDREARAAWKRAVPELTRLRLLSRLDHDLLEAYAVAYADWRTRVREGAQHSASFYTRNVLPLAKELGLTPNTRLRMRAPAEVLDVDDSGLD
jgi:phage terminase small subunit